MTITLNGTSGITTPTYGGATTAEYQVPVTAFKNRLINGGMQIDQRNAGASVTPTNAQYSVDRWQFGVSQVSKLSAQQSAVAPVGFTKSLLITSLSAYSVLSTDSFTVQQMIEGNNIADLGWGTANAKTVTLSFWVQSSLTGTFGGVLENSAYTRSYPFTYSISVANTWTQISITIAGDTTGTWATDNTGGINVRFCLGAGATFSGTAGSWSANNYASATGATSVVGTSGATFYITGVQLEKGSTATSFDYRPYGTELALCQRYFQTFGGTTSMSWGTSQISGAGASGAYIPFVCQMRTASPSLTVIGTGYNAQDNSAGPVTVTISANAYSSTGAYVTYSHSTLTSNAVRRLYFTDTTSFLQFSAEL